MVAAPLMAAPDAVLSWAGLQQLCRVTLADVVFLLLLLRVLQLGATALFNDPGTGWHLRTGQEILVTLRVPTFDPFSSTCGGHAWVATQWLGDVVLAWMEGLGGYSLIAVMIAAAIAAVFRWMYRTHVANGGWPAIAVVVTLAASAAASGHFLARPLVATTIGVPLSFWWATQYVRGRGGAGCVWLLVPIAAVWTNCHPGVLGGIATVGLCGVGTVLGSVLKACSAGRLDSTSGNDARLRSVAACWREYCGRGFILLAAAGAMGTATLLNPYGTGWHSWIAKLMAMKSLARYVDEWRPPGWYEPQTLAAGALVVTLVASSVWRRGRIRMGEGVVILFWAAQSTGSARHVPLLGMVVGLQLARALAGGDAGGSAGAIRSGSDWFGRSLLFSEAIRTRETRAGGGLLSAGVVAALVVLLANGVRAPAIGLGTAGPPSSKFSASAVAYLRMHPPVGRMFNDLNYGGTLVHDVPQTKIFADDRFELYGEKFIEAYVGAVLRPGEHAGALLDQWGVDSALVGVHLPICGWLREQPGWTEVYCDATAAVFRRGDRAQSGE